MAMAASAISTPCVNVCVIDPISALCAGCGRTTDEIAAWPLMSETERLAVMTMLGERLRSATSRSSRGGRVGGRRDR